MVHLSLCFTLCHSRVTVTGEAPGTPRACPDYTIHYSIINLKSRPVAVPGAVQVLEHKPYGFKADVFSFGITMW